jgi:hypothetical protein
LQKHLNQLFVDESVVDDAREQVSSDVELIFRIVEVKSQFRVEEGDHAGEEFFFFRFVRLFQPADVVNGFLH